MNRKELKALIREVVSEVKYQADPLFETLGQALDAVEKFLEVNKIILDPAEYPDGLRGINEPFSTGGIPYGKTKEAHYKLSSISGKPTRKYLHISIYRMDSGRYELTKYFG